MWPLPWRAVVLHDGMAAVLPLGLDQFERGVGEHGVARQAGNSSSRTPRG